MGLEKELEPNEIPIDDKKLEKKEFVHPNYLLLGKVCELLHIPEESLPKYAKTNKINLKLNKFDENFYITLDEVTDLFRIRFYDFFEKTKGRRLNQEEENLLAELGINYRSLYKYFLMARTE